MHFRAVYRLCVVTFSLHYWLEHLTCCYSMSAILLIWQYNTVIIVKYSAVRYSTVQYSTIKNITIHCCVQIVCCGFQFVLQFATFNFLLQYVCRSVDCQLNLHWILLNQLCIQNYRALYWLQLWGIRTIFHRALHYQSLCLYVETSVERYVRWLYAKYLQKFTVPYNCSVYAKLIELLT